MNLLYKNKIKLLVPVLIGILFSGCSSKVAPHGEFNSEFEDFTNENFKKVTSKNYLKDSIEESLNSKQYINLDNTKRLSFALEELGSFDGSSYMISQDSEDIFLHAVKSSHKLGIDTFDKLNQYIQDTSNYFIYIKDNRFVNDRIKTVSLKNKEVFKQNLNDIPFTIDGKMAIADILEQLKEVSGFNIIAKDLPEDDDKKNKNPTTTINNNKLFGTNSVDTLFDNVYISFSGNTIMELLNYISTSFNIYVDVDYETKTIVFQKVKSKMFNISLNNIEYSGSLDVKKSVKNDVGGSGGNDEKAIKTKIEMNILDSLEKDMQAMLKKSPVKNNSISFNKTIGSVFITADKQTMQDISLLVDNFNNVFEKQIDFQLEVYEFSVDKEFDMAVALGATIKSGAVNGSFLSSTVAGSMFNVGSNAQNGITGSKLNNSTVKLLKQTRHGYILKNSIPYSIDVTNSKSYVKTVTTETTTSSGISTTKTTPTTSEINEGTVLSILSKINGNKIEFNIQPKIVRLNGIETAVYDGNSITLPDISTNTFNSNIMMENGEKKVIGYLTTYDDTNNYSGMVPVENFILGGSRTKTYFRKETVFVVSANIRK